MRTAPARTLKLLLLPLLPLSALSCLLYLPQPTRYSLQSMLAVAPLGCPPHPRQRGCCSGLPECPGAQSPPLSWAGRLVWLQLSREQRLEHPVSMPGSASHLLRMGFALWGSGTGDQSGCPVGWEGGPLPVGPSPGRQSQAGRMWSRQRPDLVPSAGAAGSTSCPSSWGCGPSFGGCSFPCACLPLLGASSPGLICFFLPST